MQKTVEFKNGEAELVIAALLSMACPLCPLHHDNGCASDAVCREVAERIAGGELSEVYGHGGE